MEHFRYRRHFLLLICFCVLIAVVSRRDFSGSLSVSYGLYGGLHAAALVLALRARQTFWRSCLFVVLAAALSVVTLHVALRGWQIVEAPGIGARYSLLAFSAATGAMTYGILIRWCGLYVFNLAALAAVSVGCVCAAFVALFTASHSHYLGPWWIAALWWYGFSGGLWSIGRGRGAHRYSSLCGLDKIPPNTRCTPSVRPLAGEEPCK